MEKVWIVQNSKKTYVHSVFETSGQAEEYAKGVFSPLVFEIEFHPAPPKTSWLIELGPEGDVKAATLAGGTGINFFRYSNGDCETLVLAATETDAIRIAKARRTDINDILEAE